MFNIIFLNILFFFISSNVLPLSIESSFLKETSSNTEPNFFEKFFTDEESSSLNNNNPPIEDYANSTTQINAILDSLLNENILDSLLSEIANDNRPTSPKPFQVIPTDSNPPFPTPTSPNSGITTPTFSPKPFEFIDFSTNFPFPTPSTPSEEYLSNSPVNTTSTHSTSKKNTPPDSDSSSQRVTYSCPTCNKVFNVRYFFNMHIKNCDGIFKCDKCSIFFKYKQSFNRHLNNHTDKTYFPCEYCDGFFNRKDALASHLRSIHSNNINSSTNTIEEILLRTEKTEKSFICETCEHDCLTKQELKNHARTHSPTYSKCNFCLRGFKSKKGLINHQRSKHPETAPPLKRPLKKTSRRQNPKGPSYLYTSQFT